MFGNAVKIEPNHANANFNIGVGPEDMNRKE